MSTTLADQIETAAQLLHERRHRAGTGQVCGACRDDATAIAAVLTSADACDEPPTTEQWSVFSEDPTFEVLVTDDLATAEEIVSYVVDGGIAVRTVTTSPWRVLPLCSTCQSVLDGLLCCDGRRAEIEAGEAVLAAHGPLNKFSVRGALRRFADGTT